MPSCSIRSSSRISTLTPPSAAIVDARRANSRGVSALPGSLASSRARLLHSPSSRPRSTAARARVRASGGCPGHRRNGPRRRTSRRPVFRLVAADVEFRERQSFGDGLRQRERASPRPRLTHPTRSARRLRTRDRGGGQLPGELAPEIRRRSRSDEKQTRGRQLRSVSEVANSSNVLPVNSFEASARAMSPPLAASSPSTAGPSSSNHGTMSRSVSMADNGVDTQVIGAAVVVEGIKLLSLKRLLAPNATATMPAGGLRGA